MSQFSSTMLLSLQSWTANRWNEEWK